GPPAPTPSHRRAARLRARPGLSPHPDPPLRRTPAACTVRGESGRLGRPRTAALTDFVDRPTTGLVDDREGEVAGSEWDEVGHAEVTGKLADLVFGQAAIGRVEVLAVAKRLLDAEGPHAPFELDVVLPEVERLIGALL